MTILNTIIEEEKSEGISLDDNRECNRIEREMKDEPPITKMHYVLHWVITKYNKKLTSAMQRAYEAGRADWLRSEIEKLEGMRKKIQKNAGIVTESNRSWSEKTGFNEALTSIITQHKEELLELKNQK